MGFDIPMNTKGALDSSSLLALNGGGQTTQAQPQMQPQAQQTYNQTQTQTQMGGYDQSQQAYNQPQQTYNQPQNQMGYSQPQGQQAYGQPQTQQSYNQPQQTYNQPQQAYGQPQQTFSQPAPAPKQRPAGGGVHLKKGQKYALTASNGGQLTNIKLGLGWDVTNGACDLDASAFMLDGQNRIIGDDWFVFYGQTTSPDNSIRHSGDSNGQGVGDDETIDVNLVTVNPAVQKITFVVTIDEALTRGLNFSMVQNAYVRLIDGSTNVELARFNLTDYYSTVTAMVVGELYRHNGAWKFNPVGDGVAKDLAGLCEMYGVQVAD